MHTHTLWHGTLLNSTLPSTCEWRIKAKVEISARTEQRTNQRTKIKRHYVEKIQSVHKQAKSNGSKRSTVCVSGSPLHPRPCERASSSSNTNNNHVDDGDDFLSVRLLYVFAGSVRAYVCMYINQLKLT